MNKKPDKLIFLFVQFCQSSLNNLDICHRGKDFVITDQQIPVPAWHTARRDPTDIVKALYILHALSHLYMKEPVID